MKYWKNTLAFGILIFALGTVALADEPYKIVDKYSIIVDAGSSGSRLHLFKSEQYYNEAGVEILTPSIYDINVGGTAKSSIPLASYAHDPEHAGESLATPFNSVETYLVNNNIPVQDISVSVLSTAGMRLLPIDEQDSINKSVLNYIESHYNFSMNNIVVETIPGSNEGLYGWLDVNYLSNSFSSDADITKGSIDMGGASTQIAFSTENSTDPSNEFNVKVGDKEYRVFSKSFLGLGQDIARKDIANIGDASECYPSGYVSDQIEGKFNLDNCVWLYQELIKKHRVSIVEPKADEHFITYSGILYTYQFFGIDKYPEQSALKEALNNVCYRSWAQLKQDYPTVGDAYLSTYCANGSYFDDLLYSTYQLSGSQLDVEGQIKTKDGQSVSIDWTLGALLYQLEDK